MDKEEFKRRRSAIKEKSMGLWKDIEDHRKEENRVVNVLHNAESILERLDMTFEERTSLSKADVFNCVFSIIVLCKRGKNIIQFSGFFTDFHHL